VLVWAFHQRAEFIPARQGSWKAAAATFEDILSNHPLSRYNLFEYQLTCLLKSEQEEIPNTREKTIDPFPTA
jgi:hypothetical protein